MPSPFYNGRGPSSMPPLRWTLSTCMHTRTHVHSMLPLMCGAVPMAWQLLAISVGVVNPRMETEIWSYLISMVIGATL